MEYLNTLKQFIILERLLKHYVSKSNKSYNFWEDSYILLQFF